MLIPLLASIIINNLFCLTCYYHMISRYGNSSMMTCIKTQHSRNIEQQIIKPSEINMQYFFNRLFTKHIFHRNFIYPFNVSSFLNGSCFGRIMFDAILRKHDIGFNELHQHTTYMQHQEKKLYQTITFFNMHNLYAVLYKIHNLIQVTIYLLRVSSIFSEAIISVLLILSFSLFSLITLPPIDGF